jgi:hypothetical protein
MGRIDGEVKDREKVVRGLKKSDTPILKGYQIFHNYIRPHSAFEGRTPADACGIDMGDQNKWMTLIQNASHASRHDDDDESDGVPLRTSFLLHSYTSETTSKGFSAEVVSRL